ncbi:SAM-dependent methyltransferase [Gloeobacter morelensis]|uniref:Class I SAM-dependent methyltransferase n=1 Tax=Gloeobacter morelensis MG652769 TaxID=2781736 RepID=A0ABY3PG68_9CYAN|nr:methyltransferase domain-containing protein [Gloeobacter morelensis]UFP92651.1 class I SAM-dependent methyltransferase [Gloeobacter morelensis MG652769]
MSLFRRRTLLLTGLGLWSTCRLLAQPAGNLVVPYVPTADPVVAAMLKLARVGKDDFLIDLGCGDGRIVITAAREHGTRGFGVDIDPELVELSRSNARRAGVEDRVSFTEQDLFQTDLRPSSVVTLYLFPEINLKLRSKLFAELKPGSRVVSNEWDMGAWQPDETLKVQAPDRAYQIFAWTIPAEAQGVWEGGASAGGPPRSYRLVLRQHFQTASGTLLVEGKEYLLSDARLEGNLLRFVVPAAGLQFVGKVSGDLLAGNFGGGPPERGPTWQAQRLKRFNEVWY